MNIEVKQNMSSCHLKINAKGLWSGEIKCYDFEAEKAASKAADLAEVLEKMLKEKNKPGIDYTNTTQKLSKKYATSEN